eukprot:TRINITY_DN24749_c0_g1_i1.p2 TRINITY_DN24749_c0_g1~~TRINITY_DN24749_c0_g1_i1.p2  ORF type:complete len:156 (+),score=53.72 TRINITY_DN24749_c0_g1_i1:233-700(+)
MEAYKKKFGPGIESMMRDPNNMLNRRGRPMGIAFNYEDGCKVFNTFDLHRMLAWAGTVSPATQNALQEVFFRKYFKECRNLGDNAEVLASCVEAGLPEADARDMIASKRYAEETQVELLHSRTVVSGVPHFSFPSGNVISGGESVETFAAHLAEC